MGATPINREEDSFKHLAHDVARALHSSTCGYFGVGIGKCSMCPASTRGRLCVEAMLDDVDSRLRALGQQAERDRHDGWELLETDAQLGRCEYFGQQDTRTCDGCRARGASGSCKGEEERLRDLVRRAKKLAGVE